MRRQMQEVLAGRMMNTARWRPKAAEHHGARQYFLHLPPHVLAECPICISCFVQALYLFFRYSVSQTPIIRGLVPAAIKR